MRAINASIPFDKALWRQDIAASKAHVAMLGAQGIVSGGDAAAIADGLDRVAAEYEANVILITKGETALLNVVNEALAKAYADGLYGTWYEDAVALAKSENAAEVSVED